MVQISLLMVLGVGHTGPSEWEEHLPLESKAESQ